MEISFKESALHSFCFDQLNFLICSRFVRLSLLEMSFICYFMSVDICDNPGAGWTN